MKSPAVFLIVIALLAAGCSPLLLKPADFAWPIEDVLKADSNGVVHEERYSLSFNIKPLMYAETGDSLHVGGRIIHLIRSVHGYYFVTGPEFKNVYVFSQGDDGLALSKRIMISKKGMVSPAFNQRAPYIELLNGDQKPILLTRNGIHKEVKK